MAGATGRGGRRRYGWTVARRLTAPLLSTWLLVGPPIRDAAPVPEAALAGWKRYGVFPSEAECRAGLELMRRMTGTEKYGWEQEYWDDFARCVEAAG